MSAIPLPGPSPETVAGRHVETIGRALGTLEHAQRLEIGMLRARNRRLAERVLELSAALAELIDRGVPIPRFKTRRRA